MDDTSLSLLERVQHNPNESAWRDLVDLYSPLLDDWLTRFRLQPADREDLVQESLTTVLRHVGGFRHGGQGSFRARLRAVMANRVREFWRRRGRHAQATGDSDFAEMLQQLESPESALGRQWDAEHDRYVVHRLLARIEPLFEPATLDAFRRVVIEGQKPREVAAAPSTAWAAPCTTCWPACRPFPAARRSRSSAPTWKRSPSRFRRSVWIFRPTWNASSIACWPKIPNNAFRRPTKWPRRCNRTANPPRWPLRPPSALRPHRRKSTPSPRYSGERVGVRGGIAYAEAVARLVLGLRH